MSDEKEFIEAIDHQKIVLSILRRRLQELEIQEATKGINTSPEIKTEISDLREKIISHTKELKHLQDSLHKDQHSLKTHIDLSQQATLIK